MLLRISKIVGTIALLGAGAVLLADLLSIHQIYRITQATIAKSEAAQARQFLIADRARRNRQERTHKELVAGALAVDVLAIIWLGGSLFRRAKPRQPRPRPLPPAEGLPGG